MFVFDCQLIARHGGITKLSMGSTLVTQDNLSLLHSPEKQAVFIVCKNPSDCILHAEACCRSRLSAYHVCKTCQGPSVRKLRWSDCQQLSAHRKASQHSTWEPALTCGLQALYTSTKAARKHLWASWTECLFSTANLSRGTEASQSSAWGVPWYPKTSLLLLRSSEQLAVFIVCKNPSDWKIASCMQKHLADPDCQRIMCARLARDHQWENYCQHVAKHRNIRCANSRHLIHAQRLPRIMFGKAWLRVGSTGNSSRVTTELSMGVRPLKTNLQLLYRSEQPALFISSAKSSGSHPARTSTLPPDSVSISCAQKLLPTIREKAVWRVW